MILISHRGNINGFPDFENNPEKIDHVLSIGYNVEVDVRIYNDKLYLGHDKPEYKISINWILQRSSKLWIHCKDLKSLELISRHSSSKNLNYFFHDTDKCTITSKGYLWVYPGFQPVKNSIAVMPEINKEDIGHCLGICSDNIDYYTKLLNNE